MRIQEIDELTDQIKNPRTKEYFLEVQRSFYGENYRSAVVMLYSVVICDLVYKLQELNDVYQDTAALEILNIIEESQKNNTKKSSWEIKLLELIKERTSLLELDEYNNLIYLRDNRHLCAHPVLTQDYILTSPNKSTVKALIVNTLEGILIKPAFLSKKVFNRLVEDIEKFTGMFYVDRDIERFVESKYLSKVNEATELELFKSLWKFVFALNDERANYNRLINFKVVKIILNRNYREAVKKISENSDYYSSAVDLSFCSEYFADLMMEFSDIYVKLTDSLKSEYETLLHQFPDLRLLSWFLSPNLKFHCQVSIVNDISIYNGSVRNWTIVKFSDFLSNQEMSHESMRLRIFFFSQSNTYNCADSRYDDLISPVLNSMNIDELEYLLDVSNSNDQIYSRGNAYWTFKELKNAIFKLNSNFIFSKYWNFNRRINS